MSLIRLEEAIDLGLVPASAAGRFPPLARSRLFGSPLQLRFSRFSRPGAGPLERGVGRFGLQHMGPAISPLRFGLGPMMAGLGLSPGQSAVTAPGAVPVGRAAARGRGGLPDVQTLLGRGDIETVRRLVEEGRLDPRSVPPGILSAGGGQAVRPGTATRQAVEAPSGAREIAQAKQALGVSKEALRVLQAAQGGPTEFVAPPLIDPATGLPSEAAFGAQVAAEGGAQGLRTVGVPFQEDIATLTALGWTPADIEAVGGVEAAIEASAMALEAGAVPPDAAPTGNQGGPGFGRLAGGALSLAGAGLTAAQLAQGGGGTDVQKGLAAAQAGTQAASGVAQLTGSTLGGVAPALPYVGAALGIGTTLAGDRPPQEKLLDTAAYAAAPFTFGITALLPTLIHSLGIEKELIGALETIDPAFKAFGGLFKEDVPHAVREGRELARHAGQTQGFMGEIAGARDFDALYKSLLAHQTGYVGGTAPQATDVGFQASEFGPGWSYLGLYGGGPDLASNRKILEELGQHVPTAEEFFQRVRQDPESLHAGVQAGVSQGMLTPLNASIENVLRAKVRQLDAFGGTMPPTEPETGPPPSSATPAPPPGVASPTPEEPFIPSGRHGGLVTRTGLYRLHEGEKVIPTGASKPPNRLLGDNSEEGLFTYVPSDGGAPKRASKNPDAARFWRVAQSTAEAQEALRSGDPGELPIFAHPGVLSLGPRKRAASLEFLRRAQHENPAGTLSDVLALAGDDPESDLREAMRERLLEQEEFSRETGVLPSGPPMSIPGAGLRPPTFQIRPAFPRPSMPARI